MSIKRTKELRQMLKDRRGYRCENYTGGRPGWRPVNVMIDFEVGDLGNEDVIEGFCRKLKLKCGPKDTWQDNAVMSDFLKNEVEVKFGDAQALWLTTKSGVKDYCQKDDTPEEYDIPSDAIIISDLGAQGTLFLRRRR